MESLASKLGLQGVTLHLLKHDVLFIVTQVLIKVGFNASQVMFIYIVLILKFERIYILA